MQERALITAVMIVALASGCGFDQPCGPDRVLDEATSGCVLPPPPDAGPVDASAAQGGDDGGVSPDAGASQDAGVEDAGVEDAGGCATPGYGDPCTVSGPTPECACEADFCALQPGSPTGFCSRTGCLPPDPACPPGYSCMDLSVIAPQVGSLCVPQ